MSAEAQRAQRGLALGLLSAPPGAPSQVRDAIRRKNGLPAEGAPAPADLFRARRYDRGPVVPKTFTKARRPA